MTKSPFATSVHRIEDQVPKKPHQKVTVCDACGAFLVQHQHVRRLCIGFWSKMHQRGSKRVPRGSKRVPRESKRVPKRPQKGPRGSPGGPWGALGVSFGPSWALCLMLLGSLLHKKMIIMIFDMPKSAFATPVERFLVQNQHVRRLCIGFRSKMHQRGSKRVPRGSKRVPREPKNIPNRSKNYPKMMPERPQENPRTLWG